MQIFPHPALGQNLTPSPTACRAPSEQTELVSDSRSAGGPNTTDTELLVNRINQEGRAPENTSNFTVWGTLCNAGGLASVGYQAYLRTMRPLLMAQHVTHLSLIHISEPTRLGMISY